MKMKLPFKYNPKSWFLKGKEKEIAQAKNDLEGVALEKKLADIDGKPYVTVLNTHFDPNNPRKISEKITNLLKDKYKKKQMIKHTTKVSKYYSSKKIVSEFNRLFK